MNLRRNREPGANEVSDEASLKAAILAAGGVPRHIAFIMDGNGRWARQRGLPRIAGHREGVRTVRKMVEAGPEIGVEVMTFYTFSQENWRRPATEVSALMELLVEAIDNEVEDLDRNQIRLRVIGELEQLPLQPRRAMERAIARLSGNNRMTLVLALSYSGRREILRAVNRLLSEGRSTVDEAGFSRFLDTAGLPDPDLLVRTSGELRLSNFLLYQLAYTEIVVTDRHWPDFDRLDLYQALRAYQSRERRFGLTSQQLAAVSRS